MFAKDLETRLKLLYQENRLATFKKWVFSDRETCSRLKLAEAGFYFVGDKNEPDAVECFLCEKTLDGWEPTDDPWQEHIKHSPTCQFAQLMSSEDALTLYQFINVKGEFFKRCHQKFFNDEKEKLKKEFAEYQNYFAKCYKLLN